MGYEAAVLDVDGVLTRTAPLHERAWKALFDPLLEAHGDPRPFTDSDYRAFVDGKPRRDGLRDFLASRGIVLPETELAALGDRKNALYHRLLKEEGIQPYDDAVRQLERWRKQGLRIAFVSASRNARPVLEAARLLPLCDVLVDGVTAEQIGLHGKPDLFREAARRLAMPPGRMLAVEDATAGVEAAAAVGYGLVVGVARDGNAGALRAHGATRVVHRLDELADVGA